MPDARYAVIDVGTNSVKFYVAERAADGAWRTLVDRAEVTRLGEGLADTNRLQPEAIARTTDAIAAMADEAQAQGAREIAAVATAGMRIAQNPDALIDAVRERCGVEIEVISGDEEARLGYLAVVAALPDVSGALAVFETGGGSSQFTFGHGTDIDERFSVNVGAARFTERFGLDAAVPEETIAQAMEAIAAEVPQLQERPRPDAVLGMGGAVTNMAAVKHGLADYDAAVVQGSVLTRSDVAEQIDRYRELSADERRSISGLQPKRAEVILAGACIVATVLDQLDSAELTVSDRGLRHGLMAERWPVTSRP